MFKRKAKQEAVELLSVRYRREWGEAQRACSLHFNATRTATDERRALMENYQTDPAAAAARLSELALQIRDAKEIGRALAVTRDELKGQMLARQNYEKRASERVLSVAASRSEGGEQMRGITLY